MKKIVSKPKSRKGVTRVNLAPVPRVKIKKRPRGKPFEKGNGFGSATRYKKGESGNPDGRPACKEISKALRVRLESDKALPARTYAEKLAKEWVEQGLGGNVSAIVSVADRVEGRPAVSVSVEQTGPIDLLLLEMRKESKRRGKPEGYVEPQDAEEIENAE
jgi:hypothetical protein